MSICSIINITLWLTNLYQLTKVVMSYEYLLTYFNKIKWYFISSIYMYLNKLLYSYCNCKIVYSTVCINLFNYVHSFYI